MAAREVVDENSDEEVTKVVKVEEGASIRTRDVNRNVLKAGSRTKEEDEKDWKWRWLGIMLSS